MHSQCERKPVACTTLLNLVEFVNNNSSEKAINYEETTIPIDHDLLNGLDKRFFNRYCIESKNERGAGSPSDSMLLEMATVMHPAYKQLSFLDKIISERNVNTGTLDSLSHVKALIHKQVIDLAIKVANTMDIIPIPATRKLAFEKERDEIDPLADKFDGMEITSNTNTEAMIMLEFDKYLHEVGDRSRENQGEILNWWKMRVNKLPHFSQVARCLLATEASSGTIELDFGIASHFVTKNTMSVSNENIEMKLFIVRNQHYLDWNDIDSIPRENLESFSPQTPSIPFVEAPIDEQDIH